MLANFPSLLATLSLLFCLCISSVQAVATCYREDNHTAADSVYTPCNNDTPFSMCYRSQVDAGGSVADKECLPNGIAVNIDSAGEYEYWRESCSDQTWQSPYCLNAFDACPNDGNSNARVNPCGNSSSSLTWCCGQNNTACCGTSGAITIAAVLGATSTPPASPTQTPNSSPTNSPTSSPTQSSTHNGLSTGAKAGIGIGATIGALAVLGLIGFLALRMRKQRRRGTGDVPQLGGNEVYPVGELDGGKVKKEQQPLYEADDRSEVGRYQDAPVEMGDNERPHVD